MIDLVPALTRLELDKLKYEHNRTKSQQYYNYWKLSNWSFTSIISITIIIILILCLIYLFIKKKNDSYKDK